MPLRQGKAGAPSLSLTFRLCRRTSIRGTKNTPIPGWAVLPGIDDRLAAKQLEREPQLTIRFQILSNRSDFVGREVWQTRSL